ncbi:hypothetical protein AB0N23_00335 [Streptomyces sp. NPDC052644]
MDVSVVLEVGGQIVLRITPPVGAHDPDLPSSQRVPQADQHAQLVRDALDVALVVDDRRPPLLGHHSVQRHCLGRIEEGALVQRLLGTA